MTDHRARVDDLLAEYRRSREHLATVHQRLGEISATASNADSSITVTVGPRGSVTAMSISDEAFQRYRPSELAAEIVRLAASASDRALVDASNVLAPALPAGTDPQALLLGTADLDPAELAPAAAESASSAEMESEEDEDFESTNWVAEGRRTGP